MIHIDFGHILDNRKQFAGMDKDRIDFFLSYDFVKVRFSDFYSFWYLWQPPDSTQAYIVQCAF